MQNTSIHEAARSGDLPRVQHLLLENPLLANQDDEHQWRPIFHAALNRHLNIVQTLIDFGADLSAHDGYVMHFAGEVVDNKPVVELLLRYGALDSHTAPESETARQFIHAVFLANTTRVHALLLSHPALVDERYARGDTALHHACRNGDTEIVRLLIAQGADVNARNEGNDFPLYCAAGHCHVDTTSLLLEAGADHSMTLKDGMTVSEWLAQYTNHDPRYGQCLNLLKKS